MSSLEGIHKTPKVSLYLIHASTKVDKAQPPGSHKELQWNLKFM